MRRLTQGGQMLQFRSGKTVKAVLLACCMWLLSGADVARFAEAQKAPALQTYLYLVFSAPVAGKEDQYNAWYDHQHIRDVVAVPGFVSAQRYVFAEEQLRRVSLIKPKYLVIYTIETADLAAVDAEVRRRLSSGETKIDPSFDRLSFESYVYRVFRPDQQGVGGQPADARPGPMQNFAQVVFGDAVQGQDEAFNQWYDNIHEPELLLAPGFVSGTRGILSDLQMGEPRSRSRYLALFRIASTDLAAVLKGTAPKSPLSPAFDTQRTFGYTYQAIGPTVSGADVRAQRADLKR